MTTNQQNFIQASEIERQKMEQLFKQHGVSSYYFTNTDSYDQEDGYYTGSTTNLPIVFEVKNRDIPSDKYNTIFISKSKVEHLLSISKETGDVPMVFWFFNDGKYYYQQLYHNQYYSSVPTIVPTTTVGAGGVKEYEDMIHFNITPKQLKTIN
ncbi:hypothetical protein LZZ90_08370 [Flavobacterium sp. SM15]|uniref:hypothetical protein n=1 Tax=Flavobacterium sp. SM15 TaxID=2908005 RepID=UPI001EDA80CB|nr:hypothetical protein [Flavobacterium sp. SM15]MCG2611521.1 hypothetical protein [Flavobacterium sp. SM15]